jgi:hypothetical protein
MPSDESTFVATSDLDFDSSSSSDDEEWPSSRPTEKESIDFSEWCRRMQRAAVTNNGK